MTTELKIRVSVVRFRPWAPLISLISFTFLHSEISEIRERTADIGSTETGTVDRFRSIRR